jgi:hypothetical protein
MLSTTRIASRNVTAMSRATLVRRSFSAASRQAPRTASSAWALVAAGGVALTLTAVTSTTYLDSRVPVGGEIIQTGTPVKERATGISFPQLCNGR